MSGHDIEAEAAALELIDVVKEYPGSPPVRALDEVSLRIDHGELTAIVGPSGSGKSTMLHVMGTLDRPTSGHVLVDGRDVSSFGDRRLSAARSQLIGFVFQQFFLIDGMTALENVANGLLYRGVSPAKRRFRAAEALLAVGLGHRLGHVPAKEHPRSSPVACWMLPCLACLTGRREQTPLREAWIPRHGLGMPLTKYR